MNKFLQKNFEPFLNDFEKNFNQRLCAWIENNIEIKESKNTRAIEVPKYFLCFALLSDPDSKFSGWSKLCDRLFGSIKNLNGRNAHSYLSNQIHGTLKEVLHKKKLEKKHKDYDFSFNSSEFNKTTKKREIYTKPSYRSISRGADLTLTCELGTYGIHIKSNDVFLNRPQITFRGGKNPEYNSIEKSKSFIHILVGFDKYLSIQNFKKVSNHIQSNELLSDLESKDWGGPGARRAVSKSTIKELIKEYNDN